MKVNFKYELLQKESTKMIENIKMKEKNIREELDYTFGQYAEGLVDGMGTARRIDEILEGLNGVTYKAGKCFNVDNGRDKYPISLNGLHKKVIRNLEEDLIPCLDIVRKQNGSGRTEAHIRKGISTKHYRNGFNTLVANVAVQYGV